MVWLFGSVEKASSDRNLASKIRNVCRIFITESGSLSTLICRKCDGLVSNCATQLEQNSSVKRCVELSPSC